MKGNLKDCVGTIFVFNEATKIWAEMALINEANMKIQRNY
jgi:hypothetical protein